MIELIPTGWQCPICKRVYSPRQEMCLYCGPNEKTPTINNLGDWISTNPCTIDTQMAEITPCSSYRDGVCIGVKEPFKSNCQGSLSKCTEYNNEKG